MSLATRCPACSTVFRVVQDQLRVSEGWVRCGQCQEVFNALETLFDLGDSDAGPPNETDIADAGMATAAAEVDNGQIAEAVPEGPLPEDHWSPNPAPPAAVPVEGAPSTDALRTDARPTDPLATDTAPAIESTLVAPPAPSPRVPTPLAATPRANAPDEPPVAVDQEPTPSRFMGPVPDWARQSGRGRRPGGSKSRRSQARLAAAASQGADAPLAHAHQGAGPHRRRRKPDFVRQAERAALWRRPAIRAVLGSAAAVLGAMLVLQVAFEYREPLAAQVPALAPALHAGCERLGCRIGAPRAIERIRLDASDLTRTEQDRVLRFTADLHNTADFPVRAPALDLSFTDALGRVISRKVLQPAQLGLPGEAIESDAQWRIDARLAVGELQIAGYTVEVFYP